MKGALVPIFTIWNSNNNNNNNNNNQSRSHAGELNKWSESVRKSLLCLWLFAPWNSVNQPEETEEMVTGDWRNQETRAATERMPLGNSKGP